MQKPAPKKIIAVDIDDVLASQKDAMRLFVNQHYGTMHTEDDYSIEAPYWTYWQAVWGTDAEEGKKRLDKFFEMGGLATQKPVEGAIKVITALKSKYKLVVITSRPDEHAEATHKWLNQHYPSTFQDVKFTSVIGHRSSELKAKICKEIDAEYFIDDNLEHCLLVSKEGVTCLLFGEYGWNRSDKLPKNIIRVRDWQAVLEFFDEKS